MTARPRHTIRVFLLAWLLAAAMFVPAHAAAQDAAPADVEVATAPVVVDGVQLFRVRGVTSFPADSRAAQIRERLLAVARDTSVPSSSVHVETHGAVERVEAGDRLITAVIDADAALEGVSRADLALVQQRVIQQAIDDYRRARSTQALWRAAGRTGAATAVLLLTVALLIWLWRRVEGLLRRRVQERVRSVGIQSFEVVRADQIRALLESLFRAIKGVAYLGVFLVFLGYGLAQWPWTRGLSSGVAGFVLDPLRTMAGGLIANLPRLAFLVVLFVIARLVVRLIRLFFEAVDSRSVTLPRFEAEWAMPTFNMVRLGVIVLALVVAYPYIPGSQSDAFKGLSLFIGIVFSLGSSSMIANMIAGYMLIYRRAFRVGDRVKIGDCIGEVMETRLQVTHVRSLKNEEIIIPNSKILGDDVMNYSSFAQHRGLLLHTEVGIGYETPWRQVEAMLLAAASRTPGLGKAPAPFVMLKRLGDFAVVYELNVPCDDPSRMTVLYTELHKRVLDVFNEHGVQIMTPAYEGDPPEPKVVPPKDWYMAPAVKPVEPA